MNALFDQEAKRPQRTAREALEVMGNGLRLINLLQLQASTITMGGYHAENLSLVAT